MDPIGVEQAHQIAADLGDRTLRLEPLRPTTATAGGPVRRRGFLAAITGAAVAPIVGTSDAPQERDPARRLVTALEEVLHDERTTPPPLSSTQLRSGLHMAKMDFQLSRYQRLSDFLPQLVAAAKERPDQPDVVAEILNTAAHVLLKLKVEGSSWFAAERAMAAARRCGDPLAIASVTRNVATLYRAVGRYDLGERLALEAADSLGVDHRAATTGQLSLYGMLLCNASYTVARAGDRARAEELLRYAAVAAQRLGVDDNAHWTAFGPTNVVSHRISAAYALGDYGTAVALAGTVRPESLRLPERQARYWIDVARAYHQWGKPVDCYRALSEAEHCAPEEARARPVVRELVTSLLSMPQTVGLSDVRALARRLGFTT